MPLTSDGRPPQRRTGPDRVESVPASGSDGATAPGGADRGWGAGRRIARSLSGTTAPAVVFSAVVAMVGLRLVFAVFPLVDIASTDSATTRFGGPVVFVAVTVAQVVVFRWLLTGRTNTRPLRVLVVVELTLALVAVILFGRMWVAMPALGMVDVLLLLRGRLRASVAATGMVLYILALAWVYDGVAVFIGLAEFAMATLVLHLLPRLVLSIRELDAARRELTELAVAKDRLRVARDLHDTLGQQLSVALLKLDLAKRAAGRDPERYRSEIEEAQDTLRVAVAETQRVVSGLRSTSLVDELDGAEEILRSARIHTVSRVAEVSVSGPAGAVLAWVVREATTNILRHSSATRCDIRLGHVGDGVELRVRNDRPEPDRPGDRTGSGLVGLEERLRDVGGRVTVRSEEEFFELVASVPAVRS